MKQPNRTAIRRVALFAISLAALAGTANAQYYSLNFASCPKGQKEITGETLLSYITGDKEIIKDIPVCVNTIENDRKSKDGVRIQAYKDAPGMISFEIDPAYYVVPNKITIIVYSDEDLVGENHPDTFSKIELSVNEGEFESRDLIVNKDFATYDLTNGEILKKFTIRVPFVSIGQSVDGSNTYDVVINKINIAYDAPATSALEKWEYSTDSHTGYLDEDYEMPELIAVPSLAAEMAEHSSSDPDVADFNDGSLELKKEGTTTISSKLGDNRLFHAGALGTAEYKLTVEKSRGGMTVVESLEETAAGSPVLYDLSGRTVGSDPEPGIYISRRGDRMVKILVR